MDHIIIQVAPGDWIALSLTELAIHRAAARALGFGTDATAPTGAAEALCTAEELAAVFKVPVTRIEQGAREGTIPCVRIGRRIRYRRHEVEAALIQRTNGK